MVISILGNFSFVLVIMLSGICCLSDELSRSSWNTDSLLICLPPLTWMMSFKRSDGKICQQTKCHNAVTTCSLCLTNQQQEAAAVLLWEFFEALVNASSPPWRRLSTAGACWRLTSSHQLTRSPAHQQPASTALLLLLLTTTLLLLRRLGCHAGKRDGNSYLKVTRHYVSIFKTA